MEAEEGALMDYSRIDATPMAAALLILLAVVALGGITVAFSGSIHF